MDPVWQFDAGFGAQARCFDQYGTRNWQNGKQGAAIEKREIRRDPARISIRHGFYQAFGEGKLAGYGIDAIFVHIPDKGGLSGCERPDASMMAIATLVSI